MSDSPLMSSGMTGASGITQISPANHKLVAWRSGSVVSCVNEVTLRWARLALGWVTVFKRVPLRYVTKPTRSTQSCIPLGLLNRVPALNCWGKSGNVTSAGWQVARYDPIWHVSYRSAEACCGLLYSSYFTLHVYLQAERTITTFTPVLIFHPTEGRQAELA